MFVEFIKNEHVFNKKIVDRFINREDYLKKFLHIVFPTLNSCVIKFDSTVVTETVINFVHKVRYSI